MEENQQVNQESNEQVQESANEEKITDYKKLYESEKELRLEKDKTLTRQGYELGQLRKLADENLLASQKDEEKVDFYDNPDKAVQQKIQSDPVVNDLKQKITKLEQLENTALLKKEHPDYKTIVEDNDFQTWIKKSKYRAELMSKANVGYDFEAADELLTTWKERQVVQKSANAEATKQMKQKENLSKAKMHTGSGQVGNKSYTRAELVRLKMNDPVSYRSLNIQELYRTGRVK